MPEPNRLVHASRAALDTATDTLKKTSVPLAFSTSRLCLHLYAHRHRRLTASAVSDRASLESAWHALAIGYSLRRHRLAPLAVTGSLAAKEPR